MDPRGRSGGSVECQFKRRLAAHFMSWERVRSVGQCVSTSRSGWCWRRGDLFALFGSRGVEEWELRWGGSFGSGAEYIGVHFGFVFRWCE